MKYFIVFGLALLFQTSVSAQADATYYFAKDGRECMKEFATSYRKTKLVDFSSKTYAFEDYNMDGSIKSTGFFLQGDFSFKTGTYVEYYENGNEKLRGAYLSDVSKNIKNQRVNSWYFRYKNDSMELEQLYAWDTTTNSFKSFIVNFWDTAGSKKVIDGDGDYSFIETHPSSLDSTEDIIFSGTVKNGLLDGTWKGFYMDGTIFCEETYNSEGLIEGKSYDHAGKGYRYTKIEVNPEFKGGDVELIRFLQWNIEYPWKERNKNIQGKVMIRFIVDTHGKVKDPKITRSVSPSLDLEALRVVNRLPDFKPAMQRGQPVSVYFNLPVVYKLQ